MSSCTTSLMSFPSTPYSLAVACIDLQRSLLMISWTSVTKLWHFDDIRSLIMGFPLCYHLLRIPKSFSSFLTFSIIRLLMLKSEIFFCHSGVYFKENSMPLPQIGWFKICPYSIIWQKKQMQKWLLFSSKKD